MNFLTILIIFVGITGLSVLLQAFVLLGIFFSLKKTAKSVMEVTEDLKTTVVPLVQSTRQLLERVGPKVETVTTGLAELTTLAHKESKGVSVSASEILERINRQSARLDQMLTNGLDTVEKTTVVLESALATPVRQVNGILAAFKAIVDTYRSTNPRASSTASRVPGPTAPRPVQTRPPVYGDPVQDTVEQERFI